MRWTRTLKNAGALIAAGSLDMLVLRWLASVDTPERWTKLLALQADAYAHGKSTCIYDPLPFLHYPSVHAFFVGPVAPYLIVALFIVGGIVSVVGEWMERRDGKHQVAQVGGDEVDG